MPAGLDPLERELAEIDAEFEQTPPEIRKKFGVIPIIVLFFVLVTFPSLNPTVRVTNNPVLMVPPFCNFLSIH